MQSQAWESPSASSQFLCRGRIPVPVALWCPGEAQFSFLLSSPAFLAVSLLGDVTIAHLLGRFKSYFWVFPLFLTQLKTQLEQNETLVEKEQVLRQKLAQELEEVGAGEEDTRVCKALVGS